MVLRGGAPRRVRRGRRGRRRVRLGAGQGPAHVLGRQARVHGARQDRRVGGHARRRSDARGVSPETVAPHGTELRGRHVLRRAVDRSAARAREPGAGHFGDGRQQRRPRRFERPVLRGCVGAREDAEARDGADALRRRRGRARVGPKFSFVISRPYTQNTLWFKVYDYDGGFDQFIGQVKFVRGPGDPPRFGEAPGGEVVHVVRRRREG